MRGRRAACRAGGPRGGGRSSDLRLCRGPPTAMLRRRRARPSVRGHSRRSSSQIGNYQRANRADSAAHSGPCAAPPAPLQLPYLSRRRGRNHAAHARGRRAAPPLSRRRRGGGGALARPPASPAARRRRWRGAARRRTRRGRPCFSAGKKAAGYTPSSASEEKAEASGKGAIVANLQAHKNKMGKEYSEKDDDDVYELVREMLESARPPRAWYIVMPDTRLKMMWDLLILLLVFVSAFSIPAGIFALRDHGTRARLRRRRLRLGDGRHLRRRHGVQLCGRLPGPRRRVGACPPPIWPREHAHSALSPAPHSRIVGPGRKSFPGCRRPAFDSAARPAGTGASRRSRGCDHLCDRRCTCQMRSAPSAAGASYVCAPTASW